MSHRMIPTPLDGGRAWYNENDKKTAAWLRELIARGLIAPGDVDERSIVDVRPSDLDGYTQCHFFAGIGGWSLALRTALWPDDRPVWTGSCPCQPFSAAGKRKAGSDERHLWPEFHRLIRKCAPAAIFGEQVASKLGREWLSGVRADLEALGYAVGAADLCAAGTGAPHIRQRLYWLADAQSVRCAQRGCGDSVGAPSTAESHLRGGRPSMVWHSRPGSSCLARGLEHPPSDGRIEWRPESSGWGVAGGCRENFWSRYDVVHCTDGKARRFEPGSFPLADGVSTRVGRLRGYGNAIVPEVAAAFVRSYCEVMGAA